jgi:hypothetical protein
MPCRLCGSPEDYYSSGLCRRCHRCAPQRVDSCRDCLAWGVIRTHKWLCSPCHGWRESYPTTAPCGSCKDVRHVGRGGFCRLCWRVGSDAREATRRERPYRPLDVIGANRNGQQLFFANMRHQATRTVTPDVAPHIAHIGPKPRRQHVRQLGLFDPPRTWSARHGIPEPRSPIQAATLDALARDMAARHGWSATHRKRVRLGLRVALGTEQGPPNRVRASTVVALSALGLSGVDLVLMVLSEAGVLDDDRIAAVESWFERVVADLPTEITEEMRVWFDVQRHGSTTVPRRRPRAETTVRLHLKWVLPPVHGWAEAGHRSLREISRDDVLAVLPASGNPRSTMGAGLRSLFKVLKGRGIVFVNPTAGIRTGRAEQRQPLPLALDVLRAGLSSDDAAQAALTALLAFHGLRSGELRALRLTDVRGGHVFVTTRRIVLAAPVRDRLSMYLDYRAAKWPSTANTHFFVNHRTATRTDPVGSRWLGLKLGMPASTIRDDRILDEVFATDGDLRRISDLFGISIEAASRYTAGIAPAALAAEVAAGTDLGRVNDSPDLPGGRP